MASGALPLVLTIDDEEIIRDSIRNFLEDYGYEVIEAANGRLGLEAVDEFHPELVLVDLRMPEVDGLEVLASVTAKSPDTPVIVVSGTGVLADVVEALHLGAWDYIFKPIQDMSVLLHAVQSCWERSSLMRENREYQQHLEELVARRTQELESANADLQQFNVRLRNVVETTSNFTLGARLSECGHELLKEFGRNMEAEGGSLYFAGEDGLRLVDTLDPGHAPEFIPFPLSPKSVYGRIMNEGKAALLTNVDEDELVMPSGWTQYGDHSVLAFALPDEDGAIAGVLSLHSKRCPPFVEQDKEIGTILASYSSEALHAARAAEALRESEEKYRTLFNKANVGLFRYRISDGKALEANEAIVAMFEHDDHQDFVENFAYLDSFVEREHCEDFVRLLDELGELVEFPCRLRTRKGNLKWYSFTGKRYVSENYVEGAVLDISERKHGEEERERLIMAIDQTAESIIITAPDGAIIYANPAFETMTGYTREEALGRNPRMLKSNRHSATFYDAMWQTLLEGRVWGGRVVNRRKDGAVYEEELTISPVLDRKGKTTHYVAVMRDVTEQTRLEDQLRQAQKLEAVGQLAGGVAHDFNNLLQAITGYTNMALMGVEPGGELHDDLSEVLKASRRAATLIRQLLIFSRRDTIHPVLVNINETVADVAKMLRRVIGEHIELAVVPDENAGIVNADPGQIEQILMNLCVNARDAMPDGGRVTILTGNITFDCDFCERHAWAREGDYVFLAITDTGTGISPEIIDRIFEPFFTTKEEGQGTGLGLATVYGIVERQKGLLDLDTQPGQGSTFRIYLPMVSGEAESIEEGHEASTAVPRGEETILLAEDDELVRRLAVQVLERNGYRVILARDGAEALQLYEEHADDIDLALLDVVMPKKSGRAVHDHIRAANSSIPILFTSGYSYTILERGALPKDGYELISKPYTPDELLLKVRDMFAQNADPDQQDA